jgi:multiple sugar transport system substrate-binding protein
MGRADRYDAIELLQHGRVCKTAGDFRKTYMQGGRLMTADRLRITSSRRSAVHHPAHIVACAALVIIAVNAKAADLVVWWQDDFHAQENEAVREIIAAFEQETGKQVELVQPAQGEILDKVQTALAAGQPPDFLFGASVGRGAAQWAYEDRLAELDSELAPVLDVFDADAIDVSSLLNGTTGRRALYALPMGRHSNNIHVWNSLLERAGFTLADIPQDWERFWDFWCDQVQPAVRKALGRDDVWGVGLPMSPAAGDTAEELFQFQLAYESPWISHDRRPQIDDPAVRAGLANALDSYVAIWRKGCTPPASASWTNIDNNKAFLAQTVVMTPNPTLSIPGALRATRADDYYQNAATIDWPEGANGQELVIEGLIVRAVIFKVGRNPELAGEFVRFLVQEGWLAHWLTFAGDRFMPTMRKLVEQPFWLDPSDPHRMRAAIQLLSRPHLMNMDVRDNEWRSVAIWGENVWGKAVHRVVTDGISPEQAVDEAIARIKQILAE